MVPNSTKIREFFQIEVACLVIRSLPPNPQIIHPYMCYYSIIFKYSFHRRYGSAWWFLEMAGVQHQVEI